MKKLSVVYFGCSVGVYVDNILYKHKFYQKCGMESLFNDCLELMTEDIQEVIKYGVSDESEFWDTVSTRYGFFAPMELDSFLKYCIPIK